MTVSSDDVGYDVLASAQGSVGVPAMVLGSMGVCRFCSTTDPRRFRNVSHSVPEALGNKWIISKDECDDCNRLFASYDDALAKAVGPVLTLGGTPGKGNRVRQTGRTDGQSVIRHERLNGRRRLSLEVRDQPISTAVAIDAVRKVIRFTTPVPTERFIPRYAAKALAKAALTIMPQEELPRFSRLCAWVLDRSETETMGPVHVGMSFGSVGNAPPLVAAVLLRRRNEGPGPETLFLLSIGSVCLQMALMEDRLGEEWPGDDHPRCAIRHRNVLQGDGEDIVIDYGEPRILDWSSPDLEPQPLESLVTYVHLPTQEGQIVPFFRNPS